jgi:ABC-type transport system involved in multi-copper enzyme maturation permease subunit
MSEKLREYSRIIWAIATKDIADAIKNKITLTVIVSVLFIIVLYQLMPEFENGDPLPRVVLYDQGNSSLVAQLKIRQDLDLVDASSQDWMESYIGHRDFVVLGLVLPKSFDNMVEEGTSLALEGYTVHWAPEEDVTELTSFFERELGVLIGRSVMIRLEGNTVFTRPDSRGMPFLISVMMVLVLTMIGISLVPNLMLEEKATKTIETLMVSPAKEWQLVAGKALSGTFYCFVALAIAYAFNTRLITHWWLVILVGISGSLFAVSIGLLLGSTIELRQQLMLWAWPVLILLLVPVFLSLLTDLLPGKVLSLLGWVPTVALSRAFRVSFTERALLSEFGPELGLVLGATVVLLAGVVYVIRRTDQG